MQKKCQKKSKNGPTKHKGAKLEVFARKNVVWQISDGQQKIDFDKNSYCLARIEKK